MARYIDADKLIEKLKKSRETQQKYGTHTATKLTDYFFAALKNEPTADVEEVKHGEWVYPSYAPYGGSYMMRHCSLCEYTPYIEGVIYEPYSRYCPHCGAKMDGKDINVPTKDGGKEE